MLTKMLTIRANADYCLQDGKMEVRALRTIHPEEEVCLCGFDDVDIFLDVDVCGGW